MPGGASLSIGCRFFLCFGLPHVLVPPSNSMQASWVLALCSHARCAAHIAAEPPYMHGSADARRWSIHTCMHAHAAVDYDQRNKHGKPPRSTETVGRLFNQHRNSSADAKLVLSPDVPSTSDLHTVSESYNFSFAGAINAKLNALKVEATCRASSISMSPCSSSERSSYKGLRGIKS